MADTKKGREEQARNAEKRQREREVTEYRERAEEDEPARAGNDAGEMRGEEDSPRTCHRRGCDEHAAFFVFERYQEDTGHGAVVAEAFLCREHTREESPTNLDGVYADYAFRVEPLAEALSAGESGPDALSD